MLAGTEVLMVCTETEYRLALNNKWETVHSKHLARALQQIYMGPNPVSEKAKQGFSEGIPGIIEAG